MGSCGHGQAWRCAGNLFRRAGWPNLVADRHAQAKFDNLPAEFSRLKAGWSVDKEIEQFHNDLLASVRQMKNQQG